MRNEILVITITFNPEIVCLQRQIEQLKKSSVDILIIDNDSTNSAEISELVNSSSVPVKLDLLDSNAGIAAAQNIGISYAKKSGYKYVLLMDQDSVPLESMIETLYNALQQHSDAAAVGPVFIDTNGAAHSRFIRIEGFRIFEALNSDGTGCVSVDHLISSGSLIPVSVFDDIGVMDDSLFIDYVDIEWSLRARHQGFKCYGVLNASMVHSLGERRVNFFKRSVAIHSPLRHYYQVRNALFLYKRDYIPINWKIVDAYKLMAKLVVYIFSAENKKEELKMIVQGVVDAFKNISGKYRLK